jgi:molybdate transport system substrate-binding protein
MPKPPKRIVGFALAGLIFTIAPGHAQDSGRTITVFAASSLTDSLKEIAALYEAGTGRKATLSFGSSATLARQIDQGAPADVFFSADEDWMDFLQKDGRLDDGTRHDLLGNQLVLIAADRNAAHIKIAPHFDLRSALKGGRLAVADPASVPAGKYARAALTNLGVWDSVASQLAPAENVRVALEYVSRDEAPLGIVYATDAKIESDVVVAGVFPANSHPPIVYPIALTKTAAPGSRPFLAFLESSEARKVFEKDGFTVLEH